MDILSETNWKKKDEHIGGSNNLTSIMVLSIGKNWYIKECDKMRTYLKIKKIRTNINPFVPRSNVYVLMYLYF